MGPPPSSDRNNSLSCDDLPPGPLGCSPDEDPAPPPPYPLPPPPPPASHGRSTFVTALIVAVPVLAFLALCISVFIFVRRRRLRRREALLEAALPPAAPATFPDDDDDGPGGAGGEVVHHVWHIRTVGLDDAAIESIALTRYRAGGGGVLGASDCTVCLGEFQDGELLRLLPKCAHAFHVQCIDTWLRAHVSCPLCRADVMVDTAADAEQPPGADAADDASAAEQSASNTRTMDQERPGQQANEQQELRVQIDEHDNPSSLEPERPRRQIRHHGARAQNFRRVASMDSPSPPPASAEEVPEDEQAGGEIEKQGTGGAVCCEVPSEPGHQQNRPAMKRSLSASSRCTLLPRHCRARSSLLPL